MNANRLVGLGFAIIVAGVLLLANGSSQEENVSTGSFILIGPFPIIFGTGSNGENLAILSVVAGAIMIVLFVIYYRRFATPNP